MSHRTLPALPQSWSGGLFAERSACRSRFGDFSVSMELRLVKKSPNRRDFPALLRVLVLHPGGAVATYYEANRICGQ